MRSVSPWLQHGSPWDLPRSDVAYQVRFYGHAEQLEGGRALWQGGQEVLAIAHDVIPENATKNTNSLRLWESKLKRGFDLQSFNDVTDSWVGRMGKGR